MVQVSRLVHEFDIRKTQEKSCCSHFILVTDGYEKRRYSTDYEQKIGVISERLDPFKSIISKMKLGIDIEFFDPAVRRKTHQAQKHHQTKRQPKESQRCRF